MIWALSAGREGLSPTQSLIGSGCLSLKVCVCECLHVRVHSYLGMLVLVVSVIACVRVNERCAL